MNCRCCETVLEEFSLSCLSPGWKALNDRSAQRSRLWLCPFWCPLLPWLQAHSSGSFLVMVSAAGLQNWDHGCLSQEGWGSKRSVWDIGWWKETALPRRCLLWAALKRVRRNQARDKAVCFIPPWVLKVFLEGNLSCESLFAFKSGIPLGCIFKGWEKSPFLSSPLGTKWQGNAPWEKGCTWMRGLTLQAGSQTPPLRSEWCWRSNL